MALFTNTKAAKRRAKQLQTRTQELGAAGIEAVDTEKGRTEAAESARFNIYSALGAPGTYDLPGAGGAAGTSDPSAGIFSTTSPQAQRSEVAKGLLVTGKGAGNQADAKKAGLEGARTGILDPEKFSQATQQTAGFRIQSRRVAESEQLLAQEGPAWDMLENSTIGSINENAALTIREEHRRIKDMAARGGSARRTALTEATKMLAIERNNRMRAQQTWQANIALFDTVRRNADSVAEGTSRFLDNLPQLRPQYQATMGTLAQMMSQLAIPSAQRGLEAAYTKTEETMQQSGMLGRLAESSLMMVTSIAGSALAGGLGGMMPGGAGFLGGMGQALTGGATGGGGGGTSSSRGGWKQEYGNIS